MHRHILCCALSRGLQKTNIPSILEISRTRIIATCGCCGNQNFLIPYFKSMKSQPNVPCQGDCCHIRENGAICGHHKHIGKGGFCRSRALAGSFYLEKAWGLAAGWSHGLCSKAELFGPKLPFLSWKEGEATQWKSRFLQKSRTTPQPSSTDPSGVFTAPAAAQTRGSRAQQCFPAPKEHPGRILFVI